MFPPLCNTLDMQDYNTVIIVNEICYGRSFMICLPGYQNSWASCHSSKHLLTSKHLSQKLSLHVMDFCKHLPHLWIEILLIGEFYDPSYMYLYSMLLCMIYNVPFNHYTCVPIDILFTVC